MPCNYMRKTGVCRARKDWENAERWGVDVGIGNPCLTENLTWSESGVTDSPDNIENDDKLSLAGY